jgi:hypothetical protein
VLVVCPATLVQSWSGEIRKWLGNERLTSCTIQVCAYSAGGFTTGALARLGDRSNHGMVPFESTAELVY